MRQVVMETSEISIFRTSVDDKTEIGRLGHLLNAIIGNGNWNFDLEDKDRILRINAHPSINNFLAQEMKKLGFECYELF